MILKAVFIRSSCTNEPVLCGVCGGTDAGFALRGGSAHTRAPQPCSLTRCRASSAFYSAFCIPLCLEARIPVLPSNALSLGVFHQGHKLEKHCCAKLIPRINEILVYVCSKRCEISVIFLDQTSSAIASCS